MSETEAPSALWERLEAMAAAGCKRFRPLACPDGDGRCFNCQAADIVERRRARQTSPEVLRRKDAIITSLQRDVAAAAVQHAIDLDWMDRAADLAGGGRKLAEYRLNKIVNITLDMVGALIEADAAFGRVIVETYETDGASIDDEMRLKTIDRIARAARERAQ